MVRTHNLIVLALASAAVATAGSAAAPVPFAEKDTVSAFYQGDLPSGSTGAAATVLNRGHDETAYVLGGQGSTAVLAGPEASRLQRVATLPAKIAFGSAFGFGLFNTVYLIGGEIDGNPTDTIYAIDAKTNQISVVGRYPFRLSQAEDVQGQGAHYLVGGWTGTAYSQAIRRFFAPDNIPLYALLPRGVIAPAAALYGGNIMYVAGGLTTSGPIRDVYRVALLTGKVTHIGMLPEATTHALMVYSHAKLYVLGGVVHGKRSNQIVEIDPITGATKNVGVMRRPLVGTVSPRFHRGVLTVDGAHRTAFTLALRFRPGKNTPLLGPPGPAGPIGPKGKPGKRGKVGKIGKAGRTVRHGTGAPRASDGVDGDFYLDTATDTLYGPKTNGHWPAPGTSLLGAAGPKGPTGNTLLTGGGAPGAGTGSTGDVYIDTTNYVLYAPKGTGGWPAGVSLVGPQGPQGPQGTAGSGGTDSDPYVALAPATSADSTITYGAAGVQTILKMASSPTASPFTINTSTGTSVFSVGTGGAVTEAAGLTVSSGGVTVTGTSTISGSVTLGNTGSSTVTIAQSGVSSPAAIKNILSFKGKAVTVGAVGSGDCKLVAVSGLTGVAAGDPIFAAFTNTSGTAIDSTETSWSVNSTAGAAEITVCLSNQVGATTFGTSSWNFIVFQT